MLFGVFVGCFVLLLLVVVFLCWLVCFDCVAFLCVFDSFAACFVVGMLFAVWNLLFLFGVFEWFLLAISRAEHSSTQA